MWGTRLRHRTWPPERAGAGARSGRSPAGGTRRPLTVPHVADRPVFTRAFGRAGSPDCSAARGPDASCTVAARWEQFRGRLRRGEIAAVDQARRGPADPPRTEVRAGARTAPQVKLAAGITGRGSRGPVGGPNRPQSAGRLATPSPGREPCQSSRRWGTDTRARGRDPCQSGRRWGTDGPAASTSRSIRARGPGPGRLGPRLRRSRGPRAAGGRIRCCGRPGRARADPPRDGM